MQTLPEIPQAGLSMWQWIAYVAIFAAFTLGQSYFLHRQIAATKPVEPTKPASNTENPS